MNYIARIVSIEPFGNPTIWRIVAALIGTKSLVTVTVPAEPPFTVGDQIGVNLTAAGT